MVSVAISVEVWVSESVAISFVTPVGTVEVCTTVVPVVSPLGFVWYIVLSVVSHGTTSVSVYTFVFVTWPLESVSYEVEVTVDVLELGFVVKVSVPENTVTSSDVMDEETITFGGLVSVIVPVVLDSVSGPVTEVLVVSSVTVFNKVVILSELPEKMVVSLTAVGISLLINSLEEMVAGVDNEAASSGSAVVVDVVAEEIVELLSDRVVNLSGGTASVVVED